MIHALDYRLILVATNWTSSVEWHATLVKMCSDYLILISIITLLVFWNNPLWRHRYGSQKAVAMSVFSLVLALAIKMLLAFVWARSRPYVSHPDLFHLPLQVDMISFPSGHTIIASVIAVSLYLSGWRKTGSLLFLLALVIGVARVFAGVHYPTDILGGLLIGWFSAWFMHRESSTIRKYLPEH